MFDFNAADERLLLENTCTAYRNLQYIKLVFFCIVKLGFIINVCKSRLELTRDVTYVVRFRLNLRKICPTQERVANLKREIIDLMKGRVTA